MPVVEVNGQELEFPDTMSNDEIKLVLQKKFPTNNVTPTPTPEPSLYQQLRQRGANMANLDLAAQEGNKLAPETQYEKLGEFAGGINDTMGAAIKNGYHALMTDKGEQRVNAELGQLANTPVGQAGLNAINAVGDMWDSFKENNPRTADLISATGNIAGAGATLGGVGKGIAALRDVELPAVKLPQKTPPTPQLNADEVRKIASQKYKEAAEKGGVLKPDFTNKFIDQIQSIKPLTQKGKILAGDTELDNTISRIEKFRNTPFSLDEAQEVDEILGDIVDKFVDKTTGRLSKEGNKIFEIQSRFRNMVENADAQQIEGGKEGFKALKDGRKLWSTSRKMADIERIVTRAEMTDNPATSMKTGFRTLYNNPNRMRGYSQAERDLIEKAATSGAGTDLLRTVLSSRLIPIISGSTGGFGAGVAGQVASMTARGASNRLQLGKANKVLKEISKNVGANE